MEKTKKIKLFIGLFYFIFIVFFLYLIFSKFSLQEITSYEFIRNNREYFSELRETNILILVFLFLLFAFFWVLAGGFGLPIGILAGFIFGKWLGVIILLFGMSLGATALYIFANLFLKDLVKNKFLNKYEDLDNKFKKAEFTYLLIYRFIGGIPFAISNVLPCIFNVRATNFFWATFLGITPQLFLICSIGSGLEKIIDNNSEIPRMLDIIGSKEIYIPLAIFGCLIILTLYLRKVFYKN